MDMKTAKPPTEFELLTVKRCKKCGIEKPLYCFYRRGLDKYENSCIMCRGGKENQAINTSSPKIKLPKVLGKYSRKAVRTRCVQCKKKIKVDIRIPTRPVGIYQISCTECGTPMIMGLV